MRGSAGRQPILAPLVNPVFDPRTATWDYDDFLNESPSSGTIGKLNFSTLQGSTVAIAGETNHPGIVRRSTTTTINTVSTMKLGTSDVAFTPSNAHASLWKLRVNTVDADTCVRVGAFPNSIANPFTHGVYFEKLVGDTNWFVVARGSDVQTRDATGVVVTTGWVTLAYVRSAGGVAFYIDGVAVGSVLTTNIPSAGLHFGTMLVNGAAAAKTLDHDYFEYMFNGLSR